MIRGKLLPLFLTAAAALTMTACGANKQADITLNENEVELAPLEEKKLSPAEEKQVAEPEPDSVGNMMVYPSGYDETGCLYGTNTLTFYFENEGVVGGDGYIYTYESPSGAAFSSVSTSSANVIVAPMDEAGKAYTGWDKGTKIDVCFSESFERDKNYYVILDPGAFRLNDHLSKSITNASLINFRVKEYGFEPFSTEIANGEAFHVDVKLGGEAVSALCECLAFSKDGVLTKSESDVTEKATSEDGEGAEGLVIGSATLSSDGTFSPDLTGFDDSAVALKITYFNESGVSVDSSTFVLSVGNPSPSDLANVKMSVYGEAETENALASEDAEYTESVVVEDTELSETSPSTPSVVIEDPLPSVASEDASSEPSDLTENAPVSASEDVGADS